MVRTVLAVLAVMLVGGVMPAAAVQSHHGVLLGANEVGQPGDADVWGVAAATVVENALFYYLLVRSNEMPTAAHIHRGDPMESGGVFIGFNPQFVDRGGGVYVAQGMVTIEVEEAEELAANPRSFYFNVHTPSHPAGAARAQLIGSARSDDTWVAYMGSNAQVGGVGPERAAGYSLMTYVNGRMFYYVLSLDAGQATGAHVHGGRSWESGGVLVDFSASFQPTDYDDAMVAVGDVTLADTILERLRSAPGGLYVNVHTPEYPAGALRGQVLRTERRVIVPIVTNTTGLNGSIWRTVATFGNQVRNDAAVLVRFFPSDRAGMANATVTKTLIVPAESNVTLENMVGGFLGTQGNGALEVVLQQPVAPFVRVINDQSQNPAVRGAFSQVIDPVEDSSSVLRQGVLYGLYNHTEKSHLPARTNLGWFNPSPSPVMVTFTARAADGTMLGSTMVEIPGYSQWQDQVFNIIEVSPSQREQQDFYVTYSCDSLGAAIYASVVDNGTNDGTTIGPRPTQTE